MQPFRRFSSLPAIRHTVLGALLGIRRRRHALLAGLPVCLALALGMAPAQAVDIHAPDVDIRALTPLGKRWLPENPYRGNPAAIDIGRAAYAQSCARCHGADAEHMGAAADLRLVGRFCLRIADDALRQRCTQDADDYFRRSVLNGKIRLGIEHMPPWKNLIGQEVLWSIQAFVESRRTPPRAPGNGNGGGNGNGASQGDGPAAHAADTPR